jgi:type II secretory pathway pseudopilin PulG
MSKDTAAIWIDDGYFVKDGEGFEESLRGILNDYYENEMQELSESEQSLARKFIEEALIVGGRRVGVTEGVEKARYHIQPDLLKKLLDSRLIRAENTHLGRSFEISHDTLVAPILKSYEERRKKEEEELHQQELRKARRRFLTAAAIALAGILLAIVAFVFFLQARAAKAEAEESRDATETALIQLQESQLREEQARREQDSLNFVFYFENGKSQMQLGNYTSAVTQFEVALTFDSTGVKADSARLLRGESEQRSGKKAQYEDNISKGDAAMNSKSYVAAYTFYLKARELNLNAGANQTAANKIGEARNQLLPIFRSHLTKIEAFYPAEKDSGEYLQTRRNIREAEALIPYLDRARIQDDIRKLNEYKRLVGGGG